MKFRVGGEFELLEEGVYPVTVIGSEAVETPSAFTMSKDPEMLKVTFEFDEEQEDGTPFKRNRLFAPSFNEKAKLTELVKALGLPVPETEKEAEDWDPNCLMGRRCMVAVKHTQKGEKTYDNLSTFARIAGRKAKGALKPAPMDLDADDPFAEATA